MGISKIQKLVTIMNVFWFVKSIKITFQWNIINDLESGHTEII